MNKLLLLVDIQSNFTINLEETERKTLLNNIEEYLKDIKKDNLNVYLVCDQLFIENVSKNTLDNEIDRIIYELEEKLSYFKGITNSKINRIIEKNKELINNLVDPNLIIILNKLNIKTTIIQKQYGELRNIMDSTQHQHYLPHLLSIKMDVQLDNDIQNNNYKLDETFFKNKTIKAIFKMIDDYNYDNLHSKKEKMDFINKIYGSIYFQLSNVEEEYIKLISDIENNPNSEINIIGGGLNECLLEEYLRLKTLFKSKGFDNVIFKEVQKELTYGVGTEPQVFDNKINNFNLDFEEIQANINKLNNKPKIITTQKSRKILK
jgi:hypothetical protein